MIKNILLCVAGGTPQIVTETLYALTVKGRAHGPERVDEIRVITTLEGRKKIRETLLASPAGKFHQFLRDYPQIGAIQFDEAMLYLLNNKKTGVPDARDSDSIRLQDILTSEDNERAANQICEIVRNQTQDENVRIHASVAGGRKTMGLYLQAAMQLFGRPGDAMSHVLVNNEIEGKAKNFFYPRPQPEELVDFKGEPLRAADGRQLTTKDAEIYLADIPFIRLRGIGSTWLVEHSTSSYSETVNTAQADLEFLESANELRFDLSRNIVKAADREMRLSPREFFVLVLFAYLRSAGLGDSGFISLNKIDREHLEPVCRLISKARGDEGGFEDFLGLPRSQYIYNFDMAKVREALTNKKVDEYRRRNRQVPPDGITVSVAEAREKVVNTFRQVLGKITPKLRKASMQKFDIMRQGEKESYVFGLEAAPDRIKFE